MIFAREMNTPGDYSSAKHLRDRALTHSADRVANTSRNGQLDVTCVTPRLSNVIFKTLDPYYVIHSNIPIGSRDVRMQDSACAGSVLRNTVGALVKTAPASTPNLVSQLCLHHSPSSTGQRARIQKIAAPPSSHR